MKGVHCRVSHQGVEARWAEGFARIYDTAWEGYRESFGLELPDQVHIHISVVGGQRTRLYTDGEANIFLELADVAHLASDSGYRNLYGLCHEAGHIVLHSGLNRVRGLPEDLDEDFAHYAGSVVTDYVWEALGADGYPEPFEYSDEGTAVLERACAHDARPDPACGLRAEGYSDLARRSPM